MGYLIIIYTNAQSQLRPLYHVHEEVKCLTMSTSYQSTTRDNNATQLASPDQTFPKILFH